MSRGLLGLTLFLGCLAPSFGSAEVFLKGGFDLKPNDASGYDFLDGGILSFGYGWEAADHVWLEAEVQSFYQSYVLGGHVDLNAIPLNGFLNVRVGSARSGLYGGAGLGYLSEIVWGTFDRFPNFVDFSEYTTDLGVHFFGGVNVGGGVFVEYMGQTSLDVGGIYDSGWRHFALGGVRW